MKYTISEQESNIIKCVNCSKNNGMKHILGKKMSLVNYANFTGIFLLDNCGYYFNQESYLHFNIRITTKSSLNFHIKNNLLYSFHFILESIPTTNYLVSFNQQPKAVFLFSTLFCHLYQLSLFLFLHLNLNVIKPQTAIIIIKEFCRRLNKNLFSIISTYFQK